MEKIPYIRSAKVASDGAAQFFIVTEPVPSSTWLFVQHTAEENLTANFDKVRIGRGKDRYAPHWWEEHGPCTNNILYWMDKALHFVPEGQRVIFRFDGTHAGDMLLVEVEGYTVEKVLGTRAFRPRRRE